jgi:hypothetical protein
MRYTYLLPPALLALSPHLLRYTRQYDNYQSLQNAVKNMFFW